MSFISGAVVNPVRIIAPAILSGYHEDIWLLYWTAEFVGSALVAAVYKEKFQKVKAKHAT
ncbi:MAG: aquaporin [Thermoproteota archaeon]|nr:aquaporin [Thermoproteota archaeon]